MQGLVCRTLHPEVGGHFEMRHWVDPVILQVALEYRLLVVQDAGQEDLFRLFVSVQGSENGSPEKLQDRLFFASLTRPHLVLLAFAPFQPGQRLLQLLVSHATVSVPEKDHFFDRVHSNRIHQRYVPVLGARLPFGNFPSHKDIKRQLSGHESLFPREFRCLPYVHGGFFSMFRCELWVVE